jgi:coenzyme F420-dependent glucose-6-phosphate dehydrogenase
VDRAWPVRDRRPGEVLAMVRLGFSLSSEEHDAMSLVEHARAAERAGFEFAMLSDHFHPWTPQQGESPFAWSVLGAIAQATDRLVLGTGVTCPLIRIHPAIVAQAAATVASLAPGRFVLGVGTGEALNEHVTGARWPSASERRDMLEEAIGVIRELWRGELTDHHGRYFQVIDAQLFSLPDEPPPIIVATAGSKSAELAGRLGDGMIGTAPSSDTIRAFADAGGEGKPRYGQVTVCWAQDEQSAIETAMTWWPIAAIEGELSQELPLPRQFADAGKIVREDDIVGAIACGPDADRHAERIQSYIDAGYDHVYVHQVGPDQAGFLRFAERELLPRFGSSPVRAAG